MRATASIQSKPASSRIHWSMQVRGLIVATLAEVQLYGEGFQPEVGPRIRPDPVGRNSAT